MILKTRGPAELSVIQFGINRFIIATARIVWAAFRDGMSLFHSPTRGLYWAARPKSESDPLIARPVDFLNRADKPTEVCPEDYFLFPMKGDIQ